LFKLKGFRHAVWKYQFSVSQLLKMGSLNSANTVSIFFGNFTVWSAAGLSPDGHGRGAHAQPCASRGFS
jgi:hypothetical protein